MKHRRAYFLLSAGWGPVVRTLPIANLLHKEGVEIFYHVGGKVGSAFAQAGHQLASPTDLPQVGNWTPSRDWWNLDHYLGNLGWTDSKFVEQQFLAYRKIIEELKPNLIVCDLHLPGAMVARSLNIPTLSIAQSCFLPWRAWKYIIWWKNPPADIPTVTPAINTVLTRYGAEPIERAEDLQIGTITILPSIPEFDPLSNPPNNVHYVGPILRNDLVNLPADITLPTDGKLIFVYPGRPKDSSGSSGEAILAAVIPALSDLKLKTIVSVGGFDYPSYQIPQPNISFVSWVPLEKVAARSEFVIHHGGHGTCLSTLAAGIPSLILPTFAEREYNARNMINLGACFVPFNELSPEKVKNMVMELTNSTRVKATAEYWRNELKRRNYGGAEQAARLAISLLK